MGVALAVPAQAQIVLDWDPAYAWAEPGGATAFNIPAGYELKFVGDVTDFGPPFDDLDPSNPGGPSAHYSPRFRRPTDPPEDSMTLPVFEPPYKPTPAPTAINTTARKNMLLVKMSVQSRILKMLSSWKMST